MSRYSASMSRVHRSLGSFTCISESITLSPLYAIAPPSRRCGIAPVGHGDAATGPTDTVGDWKSLEKNRRFLEESGTDALVQEKPFLSRRTPATNFSRILTEHTGLAGARERTCAGAHRRIPKASNAQQR